MTSKHNSQNQRKNEPHAFQAQDNAKVLLQAMNDIPRLQSHSKSFLNKNIVSFFLSRHSFKWSFTKERTADITPKQKSRPPKDERLATQIYFSSESFPEYVVT